jgi:hypothetical protein
MNRQAIKDVVREITGPNTQFWDQANWVNIKCLFGPWLHQYGEDRLPSSGISVSEDEPSVFHCFSCKSKFPFYQAIEKYSQYSGKDFSNLALSVRDGEYFAGEVPLWEQKEEEDKLGVPLDKRIYLDLYDSGEDHWYTRWRGISKIGAQKLNLLFDPDDKGVPRILFPVFDRQYQLYGFSGRSVDESKEVLKIKDYYGLKKKHLLLGSHLLPIEPRYVILVEGLFAYARLVDMGFPVLASMTSRLSDQQANILRDIGAPVFIFYDNDKAGMNGTKQAAEQLLGYVPVWDQQYYPSIDLSIPMIKNMVEHNLLDKHAIANDPGEISKEGVQEMLDKADLYTKF